MDVDARTLAILMLVCGIVISLISDYYQDWKNEWDKYWEDIDWKDEEDDKPKRTKSGKK